MSGLSIPVLVMAGITAYVSIYHLIFHFIKGRQKENSYLYFAMLAFGVTLYDIFSIVLYNSGDVITSIFAQRGQYFSIGVISLMTALWIFDILKHRSRLSDILIVSYIVLAALPLAPLPWMFSPAMYIDHHILGYSFIEATPQALIFVFYAVYIIGIGTGVVLMTRALFVDKKLTLLPTILSIVVFFITCAFDIGTGLGRTNLPYVLEYGFLALIFGMTHTHFVRYRELEKTQDAIQNKLERQVQERTSEIRLFVEKLKDQNKLLQEMVERDGMTGLYNHAAFQSRLKAMLNASRRHRFPIAVLVMDIDDFKNYNDTYGHAFGDTVIKAVAEVLKIASRDYDIKAHLKNADTVIPLDLAPPAVRNYDIVARYGGDEFAVILLFCGDKETHIVCDRLIRHVEEIRFDQHPELRVHLSLGAVTLDEATPCGDNNLLFKQADEALYEVKRKSSHDYLIVPFTPH
ncbi:MAG: GGDEF domain-containing protein [Spirochaetes bacterium]|nr:GGDEF domain-containing protein [Spirochaetota bacterium]